MFKKAKAFSSFSIIDLEKSKVFYEDTLGLSISEPMGQLELQLSGGAKVFLYSKPDHVPATFTVLNFKVDNLEAAMEEMRRKGLEFIIYNQEGLVTDDKGMLDDHGIKVAWFKDPSGNILSVIEDRD